MVKLKDIEVDLQSLHDEYFRMVHNTDELDRDPEKISKLREQINALKLTKESLQQEIEEKKLEIVDSRTTINLISFVETHCANFLKDVKQSGRYLYRGTKHAPSTAFVGNSLKDRRPKDSDPIWVEQFDYLLGLNHIKALRANSIFCTSNRSHAEGFGELFLIFPIDGHHHFSYTNQDDLVINQFHAPSWADLEMVEHLRNQLHALARDPHASELVKLAAHSYSEMDSRRLFLNIPTMSQTHLADAHVPNLNLNWKAYVSLDKFNHEYAPAQTDLVDAMRRGREVLVNGAYVALHYKTYVIAVSDKWKIHA